MKRSYILRDEKIRTAAANCCMKIGAKSGALWQVTFEPFVRKRTTSQNSKMHVLWGEFANILGWTKDEMKEWFKKEHGPMIEKVIGDEVVYVTKPSSKYSVEESAQMVDCIYRVAAEHGVILTDTSQQG